MEETPTLSATERALQLADSLQDPGKYAVHKRVLQPVGDVTPDNLIDQITTSPVVIRGIHKDPQIAFDFDDDSSGNEPSLQEEVPHFDATIQIDHSMGNNESLRGSSEFETGLNALPIAIENARRKIHGMKDCASKEQIQAWAAELASIIQQYESGSIQNLIDLDSVYARLRAMLEEIERVYVEFSRRNGELVINDWIDSLQREPEDWEERDAFIEEFKLLLPRFEGANTRQSIDAVWLELQNIIIRCNESYHQYEQRKEEEQYPKTFGKLLDALGKTKGGKNKFNVFSNYILGKGEDERKARAEKLTDLAMDLATSGAMLLGLSILHPDPELVIWISTGIEAVLIGLFSVGSAATLGTELLEGKSQKFRTLSRKIARKTAGKYGYVHSSEFLQEFTEGVSSVARRLQPPIMAAGVYGAAVGAAELRAQMVQVTQDANLAHQHVDNRNLPPPHVTVTGSGGNNNNGGSTEWTAPNSAGKPTAFGIEPQSPSPTIPPEILSVNGIDWSRIAGDTAWDKILNYTLKINPDIHLQNAATNGAKNLLLELVKLNDPQAATPDQMLKALEHVDVKKLLQAIDVVNNQHFSVSDLASGRHFSVSALGRGTDPNEVTAILQRISTGIGAHSPQEMYLRPHEADMLVKAFPAPYPPTP